MSKQWKVSGIVTLPPLLHKVASTFSWIGSTHCQDPNYWRVRGIVDGLQDTLGYGENHEVLMQDICGIELPLDSCTLCVWHNC